MTGVEHMVGLKWFAKTTGTGEQSFGFDPNTGNLSYRKYRITTNTATLRESYTGFNKASSVTEGTYNLVLTYGPGNQRIKSVMKNNGNPVKTKYYSGSYEKEITGSTRELHYINSPYGLAAILVKQGTTTTTYYTETDHLGSIVGLLNAGGSYAEKFSFDPCLSRTEVRGREGRRRNPANWTFTGVPQPVLTDRGFTGHEHLDQFGLINMNGRIYDPVIGRFLGVDPVIQAPDNSQSFNGYSYCLNNPLKYSDPSGFSYQRFMEILSQEQRNNDQGTVFFNNYVGWWQDLQKSYSEGEWQYYVSSSYHVEGTNSQLGRKGTEIGYWIKTYSHTLNSNGGNIHVLNNPGSVSIALEFVPIPSPSSQGGMMLLNEIDGFKRIWNNSFSESTEYGALVTSKGLITFNVGKNGGDLFGGLTSTWKGNNCFVDFNGKSYQILGSVHVHWDKSMDTTPSYWNPQTGDGDQSAAYYTLRGQVPVFVLGWDENIYSISYRVNFSNFLRNYNVNSLLTGNLSLIRLLQQNP